MGGRVPLPLALADRAVRRRFFTKDDAEAVLDWCEASGHKFLGMDVAEQLPDGNWMLLIDPILDLSYQTDNFEAVRRGRQFLTEFATSNRIFEPVWEGRNT
ncbi:hypothetical protein [Erythrobacter rubeus]|uniref:Uncharacterized protein n=1 Tax=Erythrobacter rubeus TaxID=2760803 RepID=A0ABR8KMY5_9SPHN|nr:hypothetical protein [Erythrobacter rubeus]MBD2841956.1 hypothetical protein [Erythrobacter rubeus]